MTKEEEIIFIDKVKESILPFALNMTDDQIRSIIANVEKNNPDLPNGFASMLFEQVIVYKHNSYSKR